MGPLIFSGVENEISYKFNMNLNMKWISPPSLLEETIFNATES